MATGNIFGNTQVERNIYFNRAVPYLNVPAVGTTPSNATRLGITPANMAILNKLYSNPTPVYPQTSPDNLGYLELWALHTSPGGKRNPTITKLFHAIERQHLITDPIGLENILRTIYGDIPKSALTTTDRTALNLQTRKAKTTISISTEATGKLVPTYLSMKKQIHLSIQVEVTYPGTKSKKKQKGVKEVMLFMIIQAANLTTIPASSTFLYIGDMKRGTFTKNFTEAEEGMAALFVMQEKSTKGVLGNFTKVFRIVIS
jgi:hypothetical protein